MNGGKGDAGICRFEKCDDCVERVENVGFVRWAGSEKDGTGRYLTDRRSVTHSLLVVNR